MKIAVCGTKFRTTYESRKTLQGRVCRAIGNIYEQQK